MFEGSIGLTGLTILRNRFGKKEVSKKKGNRSKVQNFCFEK